MEKEKTIRYTWVNCPHCGGKIFRHVPPKKFDIEVNCDHCKAVWRIYSSEGGGVSFDKVREPKFGGYKPKETKLKED